MAGIDITLALLLIIALACVIIIVLLARTLSLREQLIRLDTRLNDQVHQLDRLEDASAMALAQAEQRTGALRETLSERLALLRETTLEQLAEARNALSTANADARTEADRRQLDSNTQLRTALNEGLGVMREQIEQALRSHSDHTGQRLSELNKSTDERLRNIGTEIDRRLNESLDRTSATFADILARLALIDEAQKRLNELSGNIVSLQEILTDKRSRGAFGEVQLEALVENVLPPQAFAFQHGLPNDRVADCMLFLPEPTGNIAVDSKFPLEAFRAMTDHDLGKTERTGAERRFKQDIRKHIRDISERYIIPNVTATGAIMFVPAEAVFAEIQAHHPDLVEQAQHANVWLSSPTTLWAILNTARAVLKDAATNEHVHEIQEHLRILASDFDRFTERMDRLTRHINQASDDARAVNTSAKKIVSRFGHIENVEIDAANKAVQLPDK